MSEDPLPDPQTTANVHDEALQHLTQGQRDLLENALGVIPDSIDGLGQTPPEGPLDEVFAAKHGYEAARRMVEGVDAKRKEIEHAAENKKNEERINYLEHHDNLTGLLNLQGIERAIGERIESSEDRSFGVLFVDLNDFKVLNDTLGHDVGDSVLKEMAPLLNTALRKQNGTPGDVVAHPGTPMIEAINEDGDGEAARTGGDEFVLLVDLHPRDGEKTKLSPRERLRTVEDRVRKLVEQLVADLMGKYPDLAKRDVNFGVAVGGSVWNRGMSVEDLIKAADQQMYADKPANSRSR